MSFPGKHDELVDTIVSIKTCVGKYMDSGHYVYDVLDYNTVTWCNYDDDTITSFSGYPENVFDDLSNENEKKGKYLL